MKRLIILFWILASPVMLFSQSWTQYLPKEKEKNNALTYFDYQGAFKQWCAEKKINKEGYYYENGLKKKAYGYKQFKRWEIEMDGMYDKKTGEFYKVDLWKELEAFKQSEGINRDGFEGNWTNICYSEAGFNNDGNGRLNCVAFHPTNRNTFWVGAPWGGVWKTTDHGETWQSLSDDIGIITVSAIAIPSDYETSQTIYLGTGDKGYYWVQGIGILKSTDGGNTWEQTSLSFDEPALRCVPKILIHPDDNNILYAATNSGIYKSTDAGDNWNLLKETTASDLEFHPGNPDIIYCGTRQESDTMVKFRVSVDSGLTWNTTLDLRAGRMEIAVSPDEPDWVYALVANEDGGLYGFYQSTDAGQTFTMVYDGSLENHNLIAGDCVGSGQEGQGWYDLCMDVDPNDAEHIFTGGINIWESTDGGETFHIVTDGYWNCDVGNEVVHVDIHCIEFHDGPDTVMACSDGGIYASYDGGGTWNNLSTGLTINQPYRISSSQSDPGEIIMGQQDNGTVLWLTDTATWVGGGDGTDCKINPEDNDNQLITQNSSRIQVTNNHWVSSHNFPITNDSTESWYKPIEFDPPNTVYTAMTKLWKSTDKGVTATVFWDPPDTCLIRRIGLAPSNSNYIYLITEHNFYRTTNGGSNWETLTDSLPIDVSVIYHIEVKNSNPDVLWICNNDADYRERAYKSTDGGETWTDISDGLPDWQYYDIIQNKDNTTYEELYICGLIGVYVKIGDSPWAPYSNGLPHLKSYDMDIYYDGSNSKLRIGTHGRGVWETDLASSVNANSYIWTGLVSTNWFDYHNWQSLQVPGADVDVLIPANTPNHPVVYGQAASVNNLQVMTGAQLAIYNNTLTVNGDADISGALNLTWETSKIIFNGDVTWKSGSTTTAWATGEYISYGNWIFEAGSNVQMDLGSIKMMGTLNTYIKSNSANSFFSKLYIDKASGKYVYVSSGSLQNMKVHTILNIKPSCAFRYYSPFSLIIEGSFLPEGSFYCTSGTFDYRGNSMTLTTTPGSYFHDFLLNSPTILFTLGSNMNVHGNLTLKQGSLSAVNNTITVYDSWINQYNNPDAFYEGTSRVIFYGTGNHQMTHYEDFYTLELNTPGDTLHINASVECNNYDWTDGLLYVDGGTFTAGDLYDNSLVGKYHLKSGTIDLTNTGGNIDLKGYIKIEGGNFNVHGGAYPSYWPFGVNSELHVSGGVLDFMDQGIYVYDDPTSTFLDNITGGVIRTTGNFSGNKHDFTPVGGYIELYGNNDVFLGHGIGSSFYQVQISKSEGASATLVSNLDLDNRLAINGGELDIGSYAVAIDDALDIYGLLTMTNSAGVITCAKNINWRDGSDANITAGQINAVKDFIFWAGSVAQLSGSSTVNAIGTTMQTFGSMDGNAAINNLVVSNTGGSVFLQGVPLNINGNLTINPGSTACPKEGECYVTGNITIQNGAILNSLFGGILQTNVLDNYGNLTITDGSLYAADINNYGTITQTTGSVTISDDFIQSAGAQLTINGGNFIINAPYTGAMQSFSGTINLVGGNFEITNDGIQFGTGTVFNFNGGNIKVGWDFKAINASSFQPANGSVELIGNLTATIYVNNGNFFNKLIINKTGTNPVYSMYDLQVNNDLVLQDGELSGLNHILTIGNDVLITPDGKLSPGTGTVNVGGDWTNNRGTLGFAESTSKVVFNGTLAGTIGTESFYKLEINRTLPVGQYVSIAPGATIQTGSDLNIVRGALMMDNSTTLNVTGNMIIRSEGGLNANVAATGTAINCYSEWSDDAPMDASHGFTPALSTVTFTGTGIQKIYDTYGETFYNLAVQKAGGSLSAMNNVTVNHDFNLNSGTWTYGASGLTHHFKGDFNVGTSGIWSDNANIISFNGTPDQDITNASSNTLSFYTVKVEKTGIPDYNILTIDSDIHCSLAFDLVSGFVNLDSHVLQSGANLYVRSNGNFQASNDAVIQVNHNGALTINGGEMVISGTPDHRPLVTHNGSGYYDFTVTNSGELTAMNTIFEYMTSHGVNITSTGLIGTANPFYNCEFRNGVASGTLLIIDNSQTLNVEEVDFPANTWSGTNNVSKSLNSGKLTFLSADGDFAGPTYEYDPYNRITWSQVGTWDGDTDTNWHVASNWKYNIQPTSVNNIVIPANCPRYPSLYQQNVFVSTLKTEAGSKLTILDDSLMVTYYADIQGRLKMLDYTYLYADSMVWQPGSHGNLRGRAYLYINGNMLIQEGSQLDTLGEWHFYGNEDSRLICNANPAAIGALSNDKIAPYALILDGNGLGRLSIRSNYYFNSTGMLKSYADQVWVFKSQFRNQSGGHVRSDQGTFRFEGNAGSYFRPNDNDYFPALDIATTAHINPQTTYSDTLRIKGDLTFNMSSGASGLNGNAFKIYVWGDWVNNVGTGAFTAGTSKVMFIHPSNPQEVQGNSIFYDVMTENSVTAHVKFYGQNTINNNFYISYPAEVYGDLTVLNLYNDDAASELYMETGCNLYATSLIQGGKLVCNGGFMNVTDLPENNVNGIYEINDGLVVLNQDYSSNINMSGTYNITGGELRLDGGSGVSYWPSTINETMNLTMTGGILNLAQSQLVIQSNNFTENISGGTVRSFWSFTCPSPVNTFHPTGGAVEITGGEDGGIDMGSPLCWFYNLYVNKDGGETFPTTNLRVKHEFKVVSGLFNMYNYMINVGP